MRELLILPLLAGAASADLCHKGSEFVEGNWYCQAVKRIKYMNVGGSGTYNRITGMNRETGQCESAPQRFSGPLAPLDEDMSLHFRGPLVLKQMAIYKPSGGNRKREAEPELEPVHPGHAHFDERAQQKRAAAAAAAVGDMVTATIEGKIQTWTNTYAGQETPAATAPGMVIATIDGKVVSWVNNYSPAPAAATPPPAAPPVQPPTPLDGMIGAKPQAAPKPAKIQPASGKPVTAAKGDWAQVGYYNMDNHTAEGVTFLNDKGGQGSGVWDMTFGNSLSYAAADARTGAAEPEIFNGKLESKQELAIFSGRSCAHGNCGFVRPGTVAYEGFTGGFKAFFFEFSMPNDGTTGWNMNQPAIWALNAQIPRVLQYGAHCSCWRSGCGELDIFEVLTPGNHRAKSTIHKTAGGGSSDFFVRPENGFIKLAVVMDGHGVIIQQLRDDYEFSNVITADRMAHIADDKKIPETMAKSVFRLASD